MEHLFCLDNRVIGGASDRIADLGQFVDQQPFLGHVDSSEAKIVRHDILGVAEHIGAFDHLALPGSAGQVLPVDRLADLAIAVFLRLPACDGTGFQKAKQPTQPGRKNYLPKCAECLGKGLVKKPTVT